MNAELEATWAKHREYVRRILIGRSRDIDLADDLVQEVYLRAQAGFRDCRKSDTRAWLAAIAKNALYDHFSKTYVHSEVPYDEVTEPTSENTVGSDEDVLLINLKEAIKNLQPELRIVLMMKHYGGFTYKEISKRLGCPVGTVKWRVNEAICRLRNTLGAPQREDTGMKCTDLTGALLLDYIEGKLPARQQQAVHRHIEQCATCADRFKETAQILKTIDLVEADYKTTCIIEIDLEGYTTGYMWFSMPNKTKDPMESLTLKQSGVEYMTIQGEEVRLEPLSCETAANGMMSYRSRLPRPVPLGEKLMMHIVVKHAPGPETARRLDDSHWRFGPGKLLLTEELLYVAAIRLPDAARLKASDPEPTEVKRATPTLP